MAEDEAMVPSDVVRIQIGEEVTLSEDAAAALNDLAQALAAQAEDGGAEVAGFSSDILKALRVGGSSGRGGFVDPKLGGNFKVEIEGVGAGRAVDVSITLPPPKT